MYKIEHAVRFFTRLAWALSYYLKITQNAAPECKIYELI